VFKLSSPTPPRTVSNTPRGSNRQSVNASGNSSGNRQRNYSARDISNNSPTRVGSRVASVGLLEAEFLASIFMLFLLMFTNSSETYASKIMALMKRGTLISILFFVLALTAATGENAAKVAKGIGALVFVATLLSTPGNTVITDLDAFFKADWTGTAEHGSDVGSADTGTSSGTSSGALGAAEGAIQRITGIIQSFGFGFIK
jgi:hypothetical protein